MESGDTQKGGEDADLQRTQHNAGLTIVFPRSRGDDDAGLDGGLGPQRGHVAARTLA